MKTEKILCNVTCSVKKVSGKNVSTGKTWHGYLVEFDDKNLGSLFLNLKGYSGARFSAYVDLVADDLSMHACEVNEDVDN